MSNYLEFFYEDKNFVSKIHKNGKVLKLTDPNHIKKLIELCHKNKISMNNDKVTGDNINAVIQEFDKYYIKTKDKEKRLKVYGQILNNMKVRRAAKVVTATSLATIIGLSTFGIINSKKDKTANAATISPYEQESILEENIYYEEEQEPVKVEKQESVYNQNPSADLQYAVNSSIELQSMMETDEFHFDFRDRTDTDNLKNAKRYEDIFEKYGEMYGVDKNLLMAIASQENDGLHYEKLNDTYATGIMQIERSAHLNSTISAYNFETGKMDTVNITQDAIEDLETNIQIGTMILRSRLEATNFNIPLALQEYNFGAGNMKKVLNACSEAEGKTIEELKANITHPLWMKYRDILTVGDPKYIEHVFSFIPNDTTLTMKTKDGEERTIKIINDTVNTYQMS